MVPRWKHVVEGGLPALIDFLRSCCCSLVEGYITRGEENYAIVLLDNGRDIDLPLQAIAFPFYQVVFQIDVHIYGSSC